MDWGGRLVGWGGVGWGCRKQGGYLVHYIVHSKAGMEGGRGQEAGAGVRAGAARCFQHTPEEEGRGRRATYRSFPKLNAER